MNVVKQSIYDWHYLTYKKRQLEYIEIAIETRNNEKLLRNILLTWKYIALKINKQRQQTWQSFEFRAQILKLQFFKQWQSAYKRKQILRRKEFELNEIYKDNLISKMFILWYKEYSEATIERKFYQKQLISKYFDQWISVCYCNHAARERYLVSKIFMDWKHISKRNKKFGNKMIVSSQPYHASASLQS